MEKKPVFNLEGQEIGYTEIPEERPGFGIIGVLPLIGGATFTGLSITAIEDERDC